MKKIALTYLLVFILNIAYSQLITYGLRVGEVQKELIENTSDYDSLVIVDIASYWDEDKIISGFGFTENKVYKITIDFNRDTSSFYAIKIRKIKKRKIIKKSKLNAINEINYQKIPPLNNDSLNLRTRTNTYMDISDQPVWTILIIKNQTFYLKQSYAPNTYQNIAATEERKIFMETLMKINELLE